jgi:hypothetical protein
MKITIEDYKKFKKEYEKKRKEQIIEDDKNTPLTCETFEYFKSGYFKGQAIQKGDVYTSCLEGWDGCTQDYVIEFTRNEKGKTKIRYRKWWVGKREYNWKTAKLSDFKEMKYHQKRLKKTELKFN